MRTLAVAGLVVVMGIVGIGRGIQAPARDDVPGEGALDLEAGVAAAELVLVARVEGVGETTIVHGGRTAQVTQQFRLRPERVLKGVFDREALLMTGEDLGIYRFADESRRLAAGDVVLVMLGRNGLNWFNCNPGATLEQSIPRLRGPDDPLVAAVTALVDAGRTEDRVERVAALVAAAARAEGRAVVPLLRAIARRPVIAAQAEGVLGAIRGALEGRSAVARVEAARALEAILRAEYRGDAALRRQAAEALGLVLGNGRSSPVEVQAALGALAEVGPAAREVPSAAGWLRLTPAATTYAEAAARLRAIAGAGAADRLEEVERFVETLPLDAPEGIQRAALEALGRLDARRASGVLRRRVESKGAAGMGMGIELAAAVALPGEEAAGVLRLVSGMPMGDTDRLAFAEAARRVKDGGFVPALGTMLDPRNYQVRAAAVEALVAIDTDEAASTLAPHVAAEADPGRRLALYAFLGRRGFKDGYAFALEQLGTPAYGPAAVEALAAIGEPGTIAALREVLETSRATSWEASALLGLGRMGDEGSRAALLAAAREGTGARAQAALEGLAALGDERAEPLIVESLAARGEARVESAARAARGPLARGGGAALRAALARLVADREAAASARLAALETLDGAGDPGLIEALRTAARDVGLEGTPLMERVERELRERSVALGGE